ncbi:MAG: ferric reductase-like transmembrane domain-containing protein [Ilumatobacteraceae bacterium]
MHPQLMWWISRATGMVASILLVASVVWGVLYATRALKPIDRPTWLLAIHRWVSALACLGVVIHIAALVGDNYLYFGWKEIFVPMSSGWKPGAVTLGVVAMYLLILVQVTSLTMKRLPRSAWKLIHYTSYAAVWLTSVHGALAGTDVSNRVYQAVAMFLTVITVAVAIVRVVMGTTRQQRARRAAAAAIAD